MAGRLTTAALATLAVALTASPAAAATTCANREAPSPRTDSRLVEIAVLCETNNQRVANGLPPLRFNEQLAAAARAHARDMEARDYFDHYSPEGLGPGQRAELHGYVSDGCCGENIHGGLDTAEATVESWMGSSGHRANILDGEYLEIGIGVSGVTFAQVFSRASLAPGITGLEPEHQGNANRDPEARVSHRRGDRRLGAWTSSPASFHVTATNLATGAEVQFDRRRDGLEPMPLPAGRWQVCWVLPAVDPYAGAAGCLPTTVLLVAEAGVRVRFHGPRRAILEGGSAVGRRATLVVRQRVRVCRVVRRSPPRLRRCATRWRTTRRTRPLLRERMSLRLPAARGRRVLESRVTVSVPAFEAAGIPYRATRVTKRLYL